jgi:antitoxin HicB
VKAVEEYLNLSYKASVYKDEDGDFVVEVGDLPGCVTHGTTVAEAFENLEEAKRVWMESRLAAGLEIPRPNNREKYSGRVLLRMPRSLHRALSNQAQQEGVSLNQHIVSLLSMGYAWGQSTTLNTLKDMSNTLPYHLLSRKQFLGSSVLCEQGYHSATVFGVGGLMLSQEQLVGPSVRCDHVYRPESFFGLADDIQSISYGSGESVKVSSAPTETLANAQTSRRRGVA